MSMQRKLTLIALGLAVLLGTLAVSDQFPAWITAAEYGFAVICFVMPFAPRWVQDVFLINYWEDRHELRDSPAHHQPDLAGLD